MSKWFLNAVVYDLVYNFQLYNVDHIDKVISKALKTEFEVSITPFILNGEGVAAMLNRVCIILNKLSIMP